MKKTHHKSYVAGLSGLLLAGVFAMPVMASEFSGGYVGAGVGAGRDKAHGGGYSTPRKTALAGALEGGYNWDINDAGLLLGVDVFYEQARKKSRIDSLGMPADFGDKGYGIDGKIGYAMDKWLPYIKLGYGKLKGTGDANDYSENGTHIGLGVEYKFADNWSVGGEFSRLHGKKDAGVRLTNNMLLVKLNYYFDKPKAAAPVADVAPAAPVAAPEPAPAPKPAAKKVTLSADALFDFDKAVLRDEGKTKLDKLVEDSKSIALEVIIATGHADRFGSDAYNQSLSEKRAQAVKTYLVGKGIEANRVFVEGKGETQPVTKPDDCKGPKSKKVIDCLQPDRRVDIEVVGTQAQ